MNEGIAPIGNLSAQFVLRCAKWPSLTLLSHAEHKALIALNVFFMIVNVLGNVFVVFAVTTSRNARQHSGSLFMVNLCFADLTVGLIAQPLAITMLWMDSSGSGTCTLDVIMSFFSSTACLASIFCLTLVSIDRYLRIVRFKIYARAMTRKTLLSSVAISWFCSVATGGLFASRVNEIFVYSALVLLVVPAFVVTSLSYLRIFIFVLASRRKMARHLGTSSCRRNRQQPNNEQECDVINERESPPNRERVFDTNARSRPPSLAHASNVGGSNAVKELKAEQRNLSLHIEIAKTFAVVILAFSMSWIPFLFVIFLRALRIHQGSSPDILVHQFHWTLFIATCNSAINPIIYNVKNRQIRREVLRVLRCKYEHVRSCRISAVER